MKTPAKTIAPVTMPCPHCGEGEASIVIRLAVLDDEAFQCDECNAEFSVESIRILIGRWTKVLAWMETAPTFSDEE